MLDLLLTPMLAQNNDNATQTLEEHSIVQEEEAPPEPTIIKHKVSNNESLIKIGKHYDVDWKRIFYKNTNIANPDRIEVGTELIIPQDDEELAEREIAPVVVRQTAASPKPARATVSRSYATSGWYPRGQCTWYVSTRRPVGNWGNASSWRWQAQRDGYNISARPVAGAIAWRGGHVAYVESVSGSSMTISEANYDWNGSIRTITVPVSSYSAFIY